MIPLLALSALCVPQEPAAAAQQADPLLERLSPPGQRAFRFLTSIDHFHSGDGGFAGHAPDEVRAMRWLWREEHAAAAFHALLDRDAPAHKLYGLVGLYYADPEAFEKEVAYLRNARSTVPFMTSCTYDEHHPMSQVVASEGDTLDVVRGGHPERYRGGADAALWPLPPAPEDDLRFDPEEDLSPEGRRAYEILRETERFTDAAIGYAGVLPKEVTALRWLWREERAAEAFHALLRDRKTSVGCDLYALCGLYFTHPRCFREIAHAYAERDDAVPYMSGCIVNREKTVAELVRSDSPHAVRLQRGQRVKAWAQAHQGDRYRLDVIGGGFPDLFRHGGGYHEPKLEPLPADDRTQTPSED